jgi:hypothetical protein
LPYFCININLAMMIFADLRGRASTPLSTQAFSGLGFDVAQPVSAVETHAFTVRSVF